MKTTIQKGFLLDNLINASHFTLNKLGASEILQGVLLKGDGNTVHFYSTNLSSYYHTKTPCKTDGEFEVIVDTKKLIEYLSLLEEGEVNIEIEKNNIRLYQGKTTGVFPFINQKDFPLPPEIKEKEETVKADFFLSSIPLVLFSASKDESRPALNGVNFIEMGGEMGIVSTDGFRLSLLKVKREDAVTPMLIPSGFLYELMKFIKDEKTISFSFSPTEKIVRFKTGEKEFYSRLIDGEFPPFERVIPGEKKTTITVEREELIQKTKLVSIFARDSSNIVVCEFGKNSLVLRPKADTGGENHTELGCISEGEEQSVAFNFRFILDFLNTVEEKKIQIEILRPDAPVVFKIEGRKDFIHIIMPVRIQE